MEVALDRKSTRLNSSHLVISYAVFCLKKSETPSHRVSRRRAPHGHPPPCAFPYARDHLRERVMSRDDPPFPLHISGAFFFFFQQRAPPHRLPLPPHVALQP